MRVDRLRQQDLVSDKMVSTPITIIGTGGIGSPTAMTLAKMGFGETAPMDLWDPDTVEAHNIPTQNFRVIDIGKPKVKALQEVLSQNAGIRAEVHQNLWDAEYGIDPRAVYVCGVDSMDARIKIWADLKEQPIFPRLFIDARMGALEGRIYAVTPDRKEEYEKTLYPSSEAVQLPCTAKATFFTGGGIASWIAAIIFRFLREESVPMEFLVSYGGLDVLK